MTLPGKQMHLRLPDDLAKLLAETCEELPALNRGLVLRGLIADQLRKPLDQRVVIVTEQLKRHPKKSEGKHYRGGWNAKNRIAGE